jgi:hypothetical protein
MRVSGAKLLRQITDQSFVRGVTNPKVRELSCSIGKGLKDLCKLDASGVPAGASQPRLGIYA